MKKNCNYHQRGRDAKKKTNRLNLKFINYALFSVFTTFAFFYLIGISDVTAKGFILQDLRREAIDLEENKTFYEQEIDSLQSFYSLSEQAKTLNMVVISDIEYIKAGTHSVAKK